MKKEILNVSAQIRKLCTSEYIVNCLIIKERKSAESMILMHMCIAEHEQTKYIDFNKQGSIFQNFCTKWNNIFWV